MRTLLALSVLAASGCGNQYRCPDPVGPIVRDDCEHYRVRYEALKVDVGFSIGGLGVGVKAEQQKLRDPSELMQVLLQQTMALCKDFNSCRVPPTDYRRRREQADRKFTAVTAISEQLKGDLDPASKHALVQKLIEVLSDQPATAPTRGRAIARRRRVLTPAAFRRPTSPWFDSRFVPPRPPLPAGVPVLAQWELTHGWGASSTTYVHLRFAGKCAADDRVYLELSDPRRQADQVVKPHRRDARARVSFRFNRELIGDRGTMTLAYKVGATGERHSLGTFALDPKTWLGRGYLAYMPDPVRGDPVAYERPWLVFFSRAKSRTKATLRCEHNGKALTSVLEGTSSSSAYRVGGVVRHHIPLPVRIPLAGGTERTTWRASLPGERELRDLLPAEAAGRWQCRVSLDGNPSRRLAFELRPNGSVIVHRKADLGAWPWWPVKTERIDNELERRRDREVEVELEKRRAR